MWDFCNDLCIRILSWMAAWFGMRLVRADEPTLPRGWMMFDPALAKEIGINKAIIYQKISGWVAHNLRKQRNIIGGRAWSYNTIPDWGELFKWLHPDYVGKLIRELENSGLLVSAKLAKNKSIQTKYYSTEAGIKHPHEPEQLSLWPGESLQMGRIKAPDDSSIETSKNKPAFPKRNLTTTPARALAMFSGVFRGVFFGSEMPEKKSTIQEAAAARFDSSDHEDVYETPATRANTPSPVAPRPFPDRVPSQPDDTTETGESTEEDISAVPAHANIFALADAEVRGWIAQDGARLQAWCEYAAAQENLNSPGGFVRTAMRISGHMPPVVKPKFYNPTGNDYIVGAYADLIQH